MAIQGEIFLFYSFEYEKKRCFKSSLKTVFSGYVLHQRMEGSSWQEIRLRGDHKEYLFRDLQCGTKYYCYIVAFNSAGYGNGSETITVKTDGNGK